MSEALSNVNLNNIAQTGNTGTIANYGEPAIKKVFAIVPKSTIIPLSAMVDPVTFNTYVNARFLSDTRGGTTPRWFAFTNLDDLKNLTKKTSTEDTGLQQFDVTKYDPKHSFRCMGANMGLHQENLKFHNGQDKYDYYYIDANGTWLGRKDPTGAGGLASYSLSQLFVMDVEETTDKTRNNYSFSIQAANRRQHNEDFRYYAAGTDTSSIIMLENVKLFDISSIVGTALGITTTTDIVIGSRYNADASDFIADYATVLTKACFVAKNITLSTTLTISTMTFGVIVVAGETYWYGWAILSAAPTATNKVQLTLAAPSAVNAIIPNANVVCEIANITENGANAAVHTF